MVALIVIFNLLRQGSMVVAMTELMINEQLTVYYEACIFENKRTNSLAAHGKPEYTLVFPIQNI